MMDDEGSIWSKIEWQEHIAKVSINEHENEDDIQEGFQLINRKIQIINDKSSDADNLFGTIEGKQTQSSFHKCVL